MSNIGDWQKVGLRHPTGPEWDEHSHSGDVSSGRPLKYTQGVPTQVAVDTSTSGTTYVGESAPNTATSSALWRCYKVVVTSTAVTVKFADGNDNFDNIYDDRASLTYS